jgi:hypothetical protein
MAEDVGRKLASDAVGLAILPLETGGELSPLLVVELGGLRDIEHFEADELEAARARAAELAEGFGPEQRCALVHRGHLGAEGDAILIELHQPGDGDADLFYQRYRPKAGRFRGFKLIGELATAERESVSA